MTIALVLISLIIIISFLMITLIYNKKDNDKALIYLRILKILAFVIFIVYSARLLSAGSKSSPADLIDSSTYGIFTNEYKGLFQPCESLLLLILRWLTMAAWCSAVLSPFTNSKGLKAITIFILPITTLLNIIFFKANIIGFVGTFNIFSYRSIQFAIEMIVVGIYAVISVFNYCKETKKEIVKDLKAMVFILIFLLIAFYPQGLLGNLFGFIGEKTKDFTLSHRITLYIAIAFLFLSYFILRNKSKDKRRLFFLIASLSGYAQYFVTFSIYVGAAAWPFHLCNTAIILMFFAFAFNIKSVFYFTYFVNVLGALCAILMPNVVVDVFGLESARFWFNHIYAFGLPILGVALKIFPRPTFKMIKKAILIFSLYFVLVMILNAWLNQDLPLGKFNVDYFFIYGDFFSDKVSFVKQLQYGNVLKINVLNHQWTFYYLFQPAVYIVYIGLMFVIWYVYDFLFKVADEHYYLHVEKQLLKEGYLKLTKELNGRSLNEPLNIEGVNMIKITNFSKKYANSKKYAVENFSLEVHDGEVFGFLGHNGAGKSTTIKSLVGIQSITEGSIEICGYDIIKQPLEAKLNIGYVSDNHAVYEKLTGREYINYVADLYQVSTEDRNERLDKYLKMFALEEAIDQEIRSYSHGMKQKIVVISSLIHNPKVWVLDEPLTGLDPTSSYQIKECMREHANNGNIVFFSSHVIEVVEKICDRIVIIGNGKLLGVFSIAELKKQNINLEDIYLKYVNPTVNVDHIDLGELNKKVA